MVVGTVHFHNPGADQVKVELDDVLSPARQKQIEALVASLARFKPTKIAIEHTPSREAKTLAEYRAYLDGNFELSRNEIHQVAFRLGKQLGLTRLYAIDHSQGLDFAGAMQFAMANGQQDQVAAFQRLTKRIESIFGEIYAKGTMAQIVAAQNDDMRADEGIALYQLLSRIGKDSLYPGADIASDWYKRNIRIYANILRIIESPNERVLVLIGGGHRPLLRQFLMQSPGYEFVPTLPYLDVSRR